MQKIELRNIIRNKSRRLSQLIPAFIIKALERLLCLKQINYIIEHFQNLPPVDFIGSSLEYMGVEYTVTGLENVRGQGRLLFAANHPLGGLDGLVLAHALISEVGDTKLIVNDLLMNIEPLRSIFVPINKHGGQNMKYALSINALFESRDSIILFPAGLCSRIVDGEITDLEWKRNFIQKAVDFSRPVVPVYVGGRNTMFFYRLAQLRSLLKIKFNVEMIWLPRQMFSQSSRTLHIHIGRPIDVVAMNQPINNVISYVRGKVYEMAD